MFSTPPGYCKETTHTMEGVSAHETEVLHTHRCNFMRLIHISHMDKRKKNWTRDVTKRHGI